MFKKTYDVVIVGGGTAGCSAAYNSAKLGLTTLLIEKNIHLGGAITSGLVIPAMHTSKDSINNDFFNLLVSKLKELNAQITYDNNPGWFNPELTKVALDEILSKVKVDILFNSQVNELIVTNNCIKKLIINSDILSECIEARYIIDATGDCKIFKLANCNFLEPKQYQPVSLRFIMSGINLKEFSKWLLDFDSDRNVTTCIETSGQIHLSTAYTWDSTKKWALAPLFDDAVKNNVLTNADRNYFQIFTIPAMPNSIAFNCPRIISDKEIDPLNNVMVSKTLLEGRKSIIRISNFCKKYFPGFSSAYISNIADALGVRVSRRIKGKYVYTIDDLKRGKKFKNPALKSNYPVDVHSKDKDKSLLETTMQDYELPIESLISDDIDNLFVAGRGVSADFYAQAALRIQPSCFSMGEAVAKYINKLLM